MTTKEKFIEIYKKNIKREGADELLNWLEESDFFTAPASTRFHLAYEGGLLEHSIHVYEELKREVEAYSKREDAVSFTDETIAIVSLLHDICKANFYTVEYRNKKNELGQWIQVPYYTVQDQLPYGHGEKSVMMISSFMCLSIEEMMAIRWHMGGFDDTAKSAGYTVSNAFEKYPLAVLNHIADIKATYFDEVEKV